MLRPQRAALMAALGLLLLLTGCVKSSTHQRALDELARARSEGEALDQRLAGEIQRREQREERLRSQLEGAQAEIARLHEELSMVQIDRVRTGEQLAEARLEAQRLQTLLSARGAEARQLQARLEQLSAIEAEVTERNRIYQEVIGKFRSLIDAGRLGVSIERGRMVINLPQDILFASGSATLGRDGRQTIAEVGRVLAEISDRRFQVEGHTDNVPIATAQFPSNWELSTARALSVVRLLIEQGVPSESLSGAGFGEFQPVAANETPEGRRLNRRIEIVMLPNLDVIAQEGIPPQ